MSKQYQEPLKGTTTVGLVFEDGVVLATEKRATIGYMIASKKAKKVYQIADRIGMTIAGGVGDAQQVARVMTVECSLYNIHPQECSRSEQCPTRYLWMEASNAMFSRLNQITFADLIAGGKDAQADICNAETG